MKNQLRILGLATALSASPLLAQTPPAAPEKVEYQQVSARSAPADYQAQAKAGEYTIAADFVSHAIPTPDGTFKSDDYVAVELAVFGPKDSKLRIAFSDFSLRINDRKMPIPGQPNGAVLRSLSDPEWNPPKVEDDKSKRNPGDPPPIAPKMPFALRRTMELKVQKAALPEGERELPVAGLLFFPHRGKDDSIHSVEVLYTGPAGPVTLKIER